MIKLSALNVESEEESDIEAQISKKVLEQIALQQYSKALDLQRKGNLSEALQLLKDLLDTELLYEVKKSDQGEKVSGPLFNLKYLCFKNLASIFTTTGEIESAIEAYTAASELDDTDVTLWHHLGLVCMKAKKYENALYAFQRGVERNSRHWPCLDKIIILLLGLNLKEQCIATIHDALQLDPGYMRGIVYRRHIYTLYKHMQEYMELINPVYKWSEKDDEPINEERAENLLKEAVVIQESYIEQLKAESFKYRVPRLKIRKPISSLSWQSVGDSLVHMHNYMSEHCYSHACYIEMLFVKGHEEEKMEVSEETKELEPCENKIDENNTDSEKVTETASENENNDLSDKDKAITDTENIESNIETESTNEGLDNKALKKVQVRRRGDRLDDLKQWGWYERKSGRKKLVNKQDDDNIYDILRRMVPIALVPDAIKKKDIRDTDSSPVTMDLDKLFDEKEAYKSSSDTEYFNTESEQNDVKSFIDKYTESSRDIIDMLKDYLSILARKWRIKWPEGLSKIYIDANKCYNKHIDIPACTDDNKEDLIHYSVVNILIEEFTVADKLNASLNEKILHEVNVVESIEVILTLKPDIYSSSECLEIILRTLWLKIHIHILNKCEEVALDCACQLLNEFDAMGEYHDTYNLNIVNFTFKPDINENEVLDYIKFLERNKKLSTVMNLYKRGDYEDVLTIVIESFEYYKTINKNSDEDMSLDFAIQLSLILDSYWALDKIECCFRWSFICLHEALKHYFRLTSSSSDYQKWTLTVIKILNCLEYILSTEGLSCLEAVSQKELSQGLEDLIRVIGHQIETNATDMPFDIVNPWIIMHYILQREEDQGRSRSKTDSNRVACDEVPNPLMVLFIAHDYLGDRKWCCKSDGKLLYFMLDTVVPRLRSPSLSKVLEQIYQYMEQCVYCLYGHGKKNSNKAKYKDHQVTAQILDWKRAQQLYEIFRPTDLPALEGKLSGISSDTECLFHRILSLLPTECDPSKYVPEIEKYIKGIENRLPSVPPLLPYKMKDIYFLLGDYYFKKDDIKMAIKYNTLDVVLNNDRFKSWAQISLAKAANLQRVLIWYKKINSERDFLNSARAAIRCFERALELDPSHLDIRIEFGNFVYSVHSFCSRLLKQASESLSMEDFEALEKQKEDLLDITHKCFTTVRDNLNSTSDSDRSHEESWLLYYMLGKVAEKRNRPPSVYLNFYLQGIKSLQESGATYPSKINYSTPTRLCIEVLELHYRIHASILKYIEQHENKPIPASVGKVFLNCIEVWECSPFKRKSEREQIADAESEMRTEEASSIQAANILKRSISDAGEEVTHEAKKLKMEAAAAKVRRSASYDTEHIAQKEQLTQTEIEVKDNGTIPTNNNQTPTTEKELNIQNPKRTEEPKKMSEITSQEAAKPAVEDKKQDSSSSSSSTSSCDTNTSDSSSDITSDSDKCSETSSKSFQASRTLTDEEITKIVSACLDALEDCASRYIPHYKALYRLAHYHFYYKKGKDIERCRDLMLSSFISRSGKKMTGLFSEKRSSNFFNNIWKLPSEEAERAGGFAFHMNRSVLLTLEILKEIDDHKTLLDLSLHLQRTPDLDKKYLKDSDREELAQQALSLCLQSLKGQLLKFSQQEDLKSNEVERQAFKCFMLDIYKAYQRVQKQPNSKLFVTLLIDAYKLVTTIPITENMNLVDLSMKYCQSLKQQATLANLDKSQSLQKKQSVKAVDSVKPVAVVTSQPKVDTKSQSVPVSSGLPKISPHDMAAAFQNYVPMLNDPVLSQQTAAALSLSYLSNITALAGYGSLQTSLQSSLQNSFQAEFYRQFLGQSLSSFIPQQKKQKRGPKQPSSSRALPQPKPSKSYSGSMTSVTKATPTSVITSLQKSTLPLTPSMGTVLSNLPPSMTANLSSYGNHSSHTIGHSTVPQAHMSNTSTISTSIQSKPPMPHQQVSPGKTLQEKLAERQKIMPSVSKGVSQEINASISRLPSSLTITKTSSSKHPLVHSKKPEIKKSLSFGEEVRPKPISSDEVIILDDD